ncbi:kinesin-like protein KIFC3 isoform X1 [Arapaima gigas]
MGTPAIRRRVRKLAQQPSPLFDPAVMLGSRKTWDLGHAPCLQELWRKDVSLNASSVDFLMSESEEDPSFLLLQTSSYPRRLTSDLPDPNTQPDPRDLLIQTLQDKVCDFQASLCSEETGRRIQVLHQRWTHEKQLQALAASVHGLQSAAREQETPTHSVKPTGEGNGMWCPGPAEEDQGQLGEDLHSVREQLLSQNEQQALIGQLRTEVGELEEKLLEQSQEVERLRSELGATDLEKQLEILVSENERLRRELSSCQNSQTLQDVDTLRKQLAQREDEAHQQKQHLEHVQKRLEEKAARVEQLEQSLREREEAESQLKSRLRECQEALSRQSALPLQVKYVTRTVEVESPQTKQTLQEVQARNHTLQEQMEVQQELLDELEQQLNESQRTSSQLQAQIQAYEVEIERCHCQLEAEMQNLEEEKNRIIEEAFIKAESEMKAVHKNLAGRLRPCVCACVRTGTCTCRCVTCCSAYAGVRMNLLTLQPALRTLTCDYNCLKKQVQDFPFMLEKAIAEAKQEICHVITEVSNTNQELLRKYKREMNLRKKCHDELVRLKGNIRVFCRVRPVAQEELNASEARSIVTFDPDDDAILHLANKGKLMTFELDKVFPPQASQEQVFQEVRSLVTSCIDGYNVCIFAYGQTGSGKTYTMEGVTDEPGINQRALQLLFAEVSEKAPDWEYHITVSMVEIYNETLRNLLGDNPSEKLDIKMCPDGSGQLYVPGLTEFHVQNVEDIKKVLDLGRVNRATACTNLNEHSSRSHALLIITVAGVNLSTGHRTSGKLNLVDLAGSERIGRSGAEGCRLREAQCINKSLAALGDVIHALRSRLAHVPFRNSRLTYLLQDSLSGDSKTLMMVQVSPLDINMSETVCSLKFAQRVRSVELGSASSSTRKQADHSPASSSPTHNSVELDSPPVTPVPLPIARVGSAGAALVPGSTRRRSQSHLSSGALFSCVLKCRQRQLIGGKVGRKVETCGLKRVWEAALEGPDLLLCICIWSISLNQRPSGLSSFNVGAEVPPVCES